VKVRSRAANRQRNRSVLAWLSALLLICAAVGGAWYGGREALRRYFWRNPDYNLAEVAIHTDGALTREQVLGATNIVEGTNIFAVNLSAARKGLMALPQVDRAEIERILPNKISIDIAERKPVAWVAESDDVDPSADPRAFLIDRDGILMRVKTPVRDYFHLPLICGLAVDNYEEGGTVDLPEMKAALQFIHLTGENPARYQVRSIDLSKGYCLEVTDERHAKIVFPLDNLQAQLDRLALLYSSVDGENREIQTVNLLVQRNVPVTFVPPPAPDPALDDAAALPAASPSPTPAATPSAASKKAQFLATKKTTVKHAQPTHRASTEPFYEDGYQVRRAIPVSPGGGQP
jgi:cell division protein FtsQ